MSLRIVATCLVWLLFTAIGCSTQDSQVSGTVTLDDQPLPLGTVAFHPQEAGPIAFGQVNSSGRYSLNTGTESGLKPGSYAVTIEATEIVEPTPGNPEPLPKLLTPAKYRDKQVSGLIVEVKPGKNDIPLKLHSK